jgi:dCMP deaminase
VDRVNQVNQVNRGFLKKASRIAQKSNCQRARTGVVIVKNNRVLVSAYNQIFPLNDFCFKKGCLRDKLKLGLGKEAEKCRSLHAEAGAVTLAAKKGVSLKNAVAYPTCQPCINCAKLLYAAGIKRVYFLDKHADQTGKLFLEKMGIVCKQVRLEGDQSKQRLRDTQFQK